MLDFLLWASLFLSSIQEQNCQDGGLERDAASGGTNRVPSEAPGSGEPAQAAEPLSEAGDEAPGQRAAGRAGPDMSILEQLLTEDSLSCEWSRVGTSSTWPISLRSRRDRRCRQSS
ncbi:uncharacterized protein LOC115149234 isoform X2 [Salmo trutta]|uniref:uncharacterized protein LOC115149234 isoform X2 n=1 Tax=Salmo trutta TaxID=8032 RepID=UPI0011314ACB|nr:uncharacterized protein LOC115149234 isoform X2 [Salmo trutta]